MIGKLKFITLHYIGVWKNALFWVGAYITRCENKRNQSVVCVQYSCCWEKKDNAKSSCGFMSISWSFLWCILVHMSRRFWENSESWVLWMVFFQAFTVQLISASKTFSAQPKINLVYHKLFVVFLLWLFTSAVGGPCALHSGVFAWHSFTFPIFSFFLVLPTGVMISRGDSCCCRRSLTFSHCFMHVSQRPFAPFNVFVGFFFNMMQFDFHTLE